MRKNRLRSRLGEVERKKTVRAVFVSLIFLAGFMAVVIRFGIPLLIQGAALISTNSGSNKNNPPEAKIFLFPPMFDALPEATPSAYVSASGFAGKSSVLTVFVNGKETLNSLTNQDGSFLVKISLQIGGNSIEAQYKDADGHQSPISEKMSVVRDEAPPEIKISAPQPGQNFSGQDQKVIEIKGQTEPKTTVMINGRFAAKTIDGSFFTRFELKEAENKITIDAADLAGNQNQLDLTVYWKP